jgi:hypothetical protein
MTKRLTGAEKKRRKEARRAKKEKKQSLATWINEDAAQDSSATPNIHMLEDIANLKKQIDRYAQLNKQLANCYLLSIDKVLNLRLEIEDLHRQLKDRDNQLKERYNQLIRAERDNTEFVRENTKLNFRRRILQAELDAERSMSLWARFVRWIKNYFARNF